MSTHPFGVEASPGKLFVTGEIDISVAADLLDEILRAGLTLVDADLVVDLTYVTFLDATAISALVEARNRLADNRTVLRLANPTPSVRHALVSGGVSEHLHLPDLAAADLPPAGATSPRGRPRQQRARLSAT